jgi:DNA processing protein
VIGVDGRATLADPEVERAYWIAFSLLPGLGPAGFAQLLRRHGSAREAWNDGEDALRELPRVGPAGIEAYRSIRRDGVRRVASRLEARMRGCGGHVVTGLDRGYPARLLTADPRPPVLHMSGPDAALAGPAVAIVGTRRASGYGLSVAIDLADELARAGVTVVSGMALGIDGAAHRSAVHAGGRSVGVLPSPLDRIYPPRHIELAREMVAAGGVLVTEIAPGQPIGRPDFARRNRLIAGLADAVVVVEAPDRSGALLTASAAVAMGRELYAVPGQIDTHASRGCNRLIADHQAEIVTSAPALLQRLGTSRGEIPATVASLSEVEAQVLKHLLERSGSIEELIDLTGHGAGAVASALTLLETRGLASAFGGATFHPTLAARRIAGVA